MDGRTQNFQQGSVVAQEGEWKPTNGSGSPSNTVAPSPVRPVSVLQPVSSSGSGFADQDKQRRLMGQGSVNGQSSTTSQLTTQRKYPFMQL